MNNICENSDLFLVCELTKIDESKNSLHKTVKVVTCNGKSTLLLYENEHQPQVLTVLLKRVLLLR